MALFDYFNFQPSVRTKRASNVKMTLSRHTDVSLTPLRCHEPAGKVFKQKQALEEVGSSWSLLTRLV